MHDRGRENCRSGTRQQTATKFDAISMTDNRLRCWVFTLNNYTEEDLEHMKTWEEWCSYLIFGKEVGESGTPHLQGYVEFDKAYTMSKVKKLFKNDRVHLEARRGTQKQAIEYCMKDGDVTEYGTKKQSGRDESKEGYKNKALQYMHLLKQGKLAEIASDPDCTFSILKHIKEMAPLVEEPRPVTPEITVRWYWGPTGTGKTRRAYWEARQLDDKVYIKSTATKWFDGYDGHKTIVFDDLRSSWFEYSYLLKLLDIYPTQVECKGGSRQWMAMNIFITSPFHPRDMYQQMQERDKTDTIEQLVRRVRIIEHMPMTPFGCWTEPKADEAAEELAPTQILTQE